MKSVLDTKFYRFLEVFSSFLFLSVVWVVACIPVLTFFPATVALFCVVRKWSNDGDFDGAVVGFMSHFRANFRQSLGIGLFWILLAGVIFVNFVLIGQMPVVAQVPLYVFFAVAAFVYLSTTAFLFPVISNFDSEWGSHLRNSALLAMSRFPTTFAVLCVYFLAVCLVVVVPVSIFLIGSVVAYFVYRICGRTFAHIASETRSHDGA